MPGQLSRRTQQVLAEMQVKGLAPDAIGKAMIKVAAEIALDPREPKPLRLQAIGIVLPYCMPRLSVTAQVTHNTSDFSRARSKDELMQMVRDELGKGAAGVLEEMMARLVRAHRARHRVGDHCASEPPAAGSPTELQPAPQSEPRLERAPDPAGS